MKKKIGFGLAGLLLVAGLGFTNAHPDSVNLKNAATKVDHSVTAKSTTSTTDNSSYDSESDSSSSDYTPDDTNTYDSTDSSSSYDSNLSNDNYYTNSDGASVHSPATSLDNSTPSGATAQCVDGSYSFSQHRSGTCSYHGGVATWL